jgi:hypothetical protein
MMGRRRRLSKENPDPKKKNSFFLNPRSVSTIEYAFLFIIVVAALMGMAIYFKRGLSGRWREAVDESFGHGRQYDPYATQEIES